MTHSKSKIQNPKLSLPRYDRYKDSGVEWLGEVPEHWEVCRNLGVFDERKECNQPKAEMLSVTVGQGIIRQSEITSKKDSSNDDKSKYKVVRVGDLAYNKMRAWQGALGISEYDGIVSPAYVVLSPRNRNLSKYFHYLFRTPQFITEANRLSYGLCDDMNSLRYEHFKTSYSPIPPDDEIDRIVAFLDRKTAEIDTLIAKKQRQIELLDEQKAILINRAVTRGILSSEFGIRNESLSSSTHSTFTTHHSKFVPSGIEWIGDIPEQWEVKRVKNLASLITKGTTPSTEGRGFSSSGIRFLKSENILDGVVTTSPEFFIDEKTHRALNRSQLEANDILFVIAGAMIGKTAIVHWEILPSNTNQAVSLIRPNTLCQPKYLLLWLTSNYVANYLQVEAVQSAQPNISMEDLGNIAVLIPSQVEQERILSYCDSIKALAHKAKDAEKTQIQALQTLRSTLIAHAVTGSIKV